ncbi:MAG TPA: hypothetical protein VFW45_15090 [Candidatus Polarisedimenticolia bacterium]|nr:hypothetical protein [Candidatus Polarisedimenticolia bacterium]
MRFAPGLLLMPMMLLGCAHPMEARRVPPAPPAQDIDAAAQPLPAEVVSSFPTPPAAPADEPVDFAKILPVLEHRCTPCHFPGGSMHERLPFERVATIRALGTKLFTRIKDPAEQALILRFLSTPAESDPASDKSFSPPL